MVAGCGEAAGHLSCRLLAPSSAAEVTGLAEFGGVVDDAGAGGAVQHGNGAPLDYSGLPGAVNRGWDVSRFGELTVPDSAALRGNALRLEAWVRTNDPIDSGGGIGIFATNPYPGILFKGSRDRQSVV